MPTAKHRILKIKEGVFVLDCAEKQHSIVIDPPSNHIKMICPVCNKAHLDITPLDKNSWHIEEISFENFLP